MWRPSRPHRLDKGERQCKNSAQFRPGVSRIDKVRPAPRFPARTEALRGAGTRSCRTGVRALASTSESTATRRDFLYIATGAVGAVGVAGVAWPLISQMNPDASVLALASIQLDISSIAEGSSITVMWRGMPVFV